MVITPFGCRSRTGAISASQRTVRGVVVGKEDKSENDVVEIFAVDAHAQLE